MSSEQPPVNRKKAVKKPLSWIHVETEPCPQCGHMSEQLRIETRQVRGFGDLKGKREFKFSKHRCRRCRKSFNVDLANLGKGCAEFSVEPGLRYFKNVVDLAVRLVREEGKTLREAHNILLNEPYLVHVPVMTLCNWAAKFSTSEDS